MINEELKEAFLSWKDNSPHYQSRNEVININSNIIAVLKYPDGHIEPHFSHNLVVTTGEEYYIELIGQITPTNAFDTMTLGNPAGNDTLAADDDFGDLGSPITGSKKVIDGGYPQNNDPDVANPGSGEFVHTWRKSYLTTDFNTDSAPDLRSGVIVIPSATGTDPILNHWNFISPFAKPSTAALVVWVNHNLQGV